MNTVFTFKATKADSNKDVQYKVDLGQHILNGLSANIIEGLAERAMVVELQNKKGSLLRSSESVEDAEETLQDTFEYPKATVEVYIPERKAPRKELTVDDMIKQVKAGKISKEDLIKRLAELS